MCDRSSCLCVGVTQHFGKENEMYLLQFTVWALRMMSSGSIFYSPLTIWVTLLRRVASICAFPF